MDNVKAACNWTIIGGGNWEQAIQTEFVDDEIVKPEISDIVHDERALLLRRKMEVDGETESCKLELKIFPRYKISALNIVCSAPKIEVFLGTQDEYYETEHGYELKEDNDSTESLRVYRYDIEIEKSGICELTLKLLTNSDEICIFAILLQIAPNPNGVTTLLPSPINIENVKQMLESSSHKLTPNAEKCKKLLEMSVKVPVTTSTNSLRQDNVNIVSTQLKNHIDKQFKELETRVMARLDEIETHQMAKLDEILKKVGELK